MATLSVIEYTSTGFVVGVSGITEPTYIKFSYMAI
jgi:hypothetical protein